MFQGDGDDLSKPLKHAESGQNKVNKFHRRVRKHDLTSEKLGNDIGTSSGLESESPSFITKVCVLHNPLVRQVVFLREGHQTLIGSMFGLEFRG